MLISATCAAEGIGQIFAIPSIFRGLYLRTDRRGPHRYHGARPVEHHPSALGDAKLPTTFLLLTAFANGCTAMTGVRRCRTVCRRSARRRPERGRHARDDGGVDRDVSASRFWRTRIR
jgi:hypothetical protein